MQVSGKRRKIVVIGRQRQRVDAAVVARIIIALGKRMLAEEEAKKQRKASRPDAGDGGRA